MRGSAPDGRWRTKLTKPAVSYWMRSRLKDLALPPAGGGASSGGGCAGESSIETPAIARGCGTITTTFSDPATVALFGRLTESVRVWAPGGNGFRGTRTHWPSGSERAAPIVVLPALTVTMDPAAARPATTRRRDGSMRTTSKLGAMLRADAWDALPRTVRADGGGVAGGAGFWGDHSHQRPGRTERVRLPSHQSNARGAANEPKQRQKHGGCAWRAFLLSRGLLPWTQASPLSPASQ